MGRSGPVITGLLLGAALAGCQGEPVSPPPPPPPPPPPSPVAQCGSQATLQLSVGQHQVVDPGATSGCVRVPTAGAAGAEYIVVVASGAPTRSTSGVSGGYYVRASNPGASSVATPAVSRAEVAEPLVSRTSAADRFHMTLRHREAALAADPSNRSVQAAPSVPAAPPVVGDTRTFKACKNLACSAFDDVLATARYVGTKAAIYMENDVPTADTLRAEDYDELGRTFDTYHYPIDAAAFGTESDIDTNERIVILMTKSVNNLTPDCTSGRVLGYFFGLDLITTGSQSVNSNKAEIFYTFVPSPSTPTCTAINRVQTLYSVKPTLIHELQHMISWNKRVIQGGGNAEETWLNEGMSHFAEELGGRLIPADQCPPPSGSSAPSCRSQYTSGDILNAYDYLASTEDHFLIYPTSSNGTLEERGASWHFLRWVIDQFATDSLIGSDFTPSLVTGPGGAATIAARTGQSLAQLVPEWLLASYLDDLPSFTAASPRLRFKSWGLRSIFTNPLNQGPPIGTGPFNGFPIKPDSTSGSYTKSGTLRGGSGRHFRLIQQANGPGIDFQLVKDAAGTAIDPALVARIGIARVR